MLDDCSRVVKSALDAGAEQAEAFILERKGLEHVVEKNSFKVVAAENTVGLALRVVKDGRLGFSFTTDLANDKASVERALAVSKFGKELKDFNFPSDNDFPTVEKAYDRDFADLPIEYGIEGCGEIVNGALEVEKEVNVKKARLRFGVETSSVGNSQGLEAQDSSTYMVVEVDTVLKKNGVSTGEEVYWSKLMDADFHRIGRTSAQWAVDSSRPKKIKGGKMTVLFHPLAFRQMLEFILAPALYADRAMKGESAFSDRIGETIASEGISIYDNPTMPNGPNTGKMDDEGIPSTRTDLISNGRLDAYLYDVVTASDYSQTSTGNAIRVSRLSEYREFKYPPTVSARNLVFEGPPKSFEDLIGETENGVFVHAILGAHTSNPASGDFSISSPRILRVKKGEITHSVNPVMIGGNLPSMLSKVSGVGDDRRSMKGGIGALGLITPTVGFDGVQVTS